jgi:hypothetical protein
MGGFVLEFEEAQSHDTAETINEFLHHDKSQSTRAPQPAIPFSDVDQRAGRTITVRLGQTWNVTCFRTPTA